MMRKFSFAVVVFAVSLLYACTTYGGESSGATVTQTPMGESPSGKKAVIGEYLDSLIFLAYFDDKADVDPFLMKSAVGIANRYLAEKGVRFVDLETVEKNKRDQELAYEDQAGESASLIRWIAGKLNADIYVEINADTSSGGTDSNYTGRADITLSCFDLATGALIVSAASGSEETFSTSSELDAVNNAIQSTLLQVMPAAMEQVYERLGEAAETGIPYELIILSTPDTRPMQDFEGELETRVERIEVISRAPEETIYRVFLIGAAEDLQNIVFETADLTPALQNLELVYLRGKSLTFASGL